MKGYDRVYLKDQLVPTDLYKLEPAKLLKNISGTDDPAEDDLLKIEHCHIYHTVNSDGKPLVRCTAVGGHFHEMKVSQQESSKAPIMKCASGPLQEYRKKVKGKYIKVFGPVNSYDNHTHDVTYINSREILRRKANPDAANVHAIEANKGASASGVADAGPRR